MISSELRIGNIVNTSDYINLEVLGISSINVGLKLEYTKFISVNIDELKPIPLTKEWLLKFGFDFSIDTWYLNGVAIWETECCDAKGNEEIGFFYELRDVGMMDMNIKYVHQLQNLYFALTGKELIIK